MRESSRARSIVERALRVPDTRQSCQSCIDELIQSGRTLRPTHRVCPIRCYGQLSAQKLKYREHVGELDSSGELHPIRNALPVALQTKNVQRADCTDRQCPRSCAGRRLPRAAGGLSLAGVHQFSRLRPRERGHQSPGVNRPDTGCGLSDVHWRRLNASIG